MTLQETRLEVPDMGLTCAFCMGRTFRRSRLKFKDVGGLLTLHYPVRCLSCSKRQSVGMDVARRAVPSTVRQMRAPKGASTWDGSPWSETAAPETAKKPELVVKGPSTAEGDAPARLTMTMPDLHGVTLPHVAQMPPGNGENLV